MVRLSRPASAACTVRSGTSPGCRPVTARLLRRGAALAAIIDGSLEKAMPRNALAQHLLSFCPSFSIRTRAHGVYPLSSCARVFALAMHSIQNQGAGLSWPLGALRADFVRRLASVAAGCRQPRHITS